MMVNLNLVTDKVEARLSVMGCLRGPVDLVKLVMESLREGLKADKLGPGGSRRNKLEKRVRKGAAHA